MINRKVTDAFKPYLTTPEGRSILALIGANSGTPIVLCEDSDTVQTVFDRALSYDDTPLIASLADGGEFRFMRVSPGNAASDDIAPVDPAAAIGLLFDLMEQVHRVTVRLTAWTSVEGEIVDDSGPEQLALV